MKIPPFLIALAVSTVSLSAQIPTPRATQSDPIVGEWRYFNSTLVQMTEDGQAVGPKNRGTWEFLNNKETERKYIIKWDVGLFIDYLTLSRDGKRLSGKSAKGDRIFADRIERAAPPPPTTPPVAAATPKLSTPQQTLKGSFYVSVDDGASIYVNGNKVHTAKINESRSPEMELKTGDRVVVHLHNATAEHRFMMLFVGSDQSNIVSFRARDFRMVPELGVTDFSPEQFQQWTKQGRLERYQSRLPVKSYSDWVWGDGDESIIACSVTAPMFSQKPR
jgi:hypothetical protein